MRHELARDLKSTRAVSGREQEGLEEGTYCCASTIERPNSMRTVWEKLQELGSGSRNERGSKTNIAHR